MEIPYLKRVLACKREFHLQNWTNLQEISPPLCCLHRHCRIKESSEQYFFIFTSVLKMGHMASVHLLHYRNEQHSQAATPLPRDVLSSINHFSSRDWQCFSPLPLGNAASQVPAWVKRRRKRAHHSKHIVHNEKGGNDAGTKLAGSTFWHLT